MRKNFRFFSKMIVMMFLSVLVLENVSGEAYASEIQTEPEQNYIIAMEGIEEETSPEQSSPEAHTEELSEENNQKEGINTSYKITLNANGGYFSNEIDDLSGEYIEYAELITKVIYYGDSIDTEPLNNNGNSTSFVGWSFDQDGDIEIQSRESFYPINNCTLYAVWDIKPNTLNSEDSYDLIESNRQEIENLFNTEDYDDEIILQKSEENELDQLTEIESADIPEPEELNNDTYNSSTQNDVFSEKIEAFEGIQNDSDLQSLPQGYDFDEDTHTLTLTDFTGEESLNTAVGTVQVYVDGDLNIVLNGSNQLLIESDYGIYCEGNLRISGNGSLNIANISTGIYAGHEIIVEQADVSIEDATAGIVANYGDVTIANASITMNNRILAKNGGDFRMNGGNVVASHIECSDFILDSGNITAAIKTTGSIEVKDGIIDATLKNDNYDGIYFGIESSGNSIVIKGGELYTNCSYSLSAIEAPHADMTVSGGLINAEGSWSGVSLRSFSMSEGETAITCNEGSGIVCPVNVTGGKLTIDVKNARGNSGGIEGGLTLEEGNVSISSNTAGIIGETTVNGGELVVNSGTYGLYGNGFGRFSFYGGEIYITGEQQAMETIEFLDAHIPFETGRSQDKALFAKEYLGEKFMHLSEAGNINYNASSEGIVAVGQNEVNGILSGEGWSFDSNKRMLTLSNYTGSSSYTDTTDSIQIYSDGDLHITLLGKNSLFMESNYGIYCKGNLTISGNGSLDIANISTGIYAGNEITVEQARISIEDATAGIVANYGDVTIANASITMNNRILAKNGGDFRMNGGNVVASHIECSDFILDSGNITAAIKTTGSIEVKDGIIDATLKNDNYDGIYFGIESSGNSIVIKGGELYTNCSYSLSAIEAPHADMTVSGGLINAEGSWSGVSLRSFSMSEGETAITCNEGSGIVCPVNVTGGRLTIDVKDARGNSGGIEGGLSLEGGNVSISSSTAGIIGETTVNGGELVVNSGTYGLYGYGSKAFVFNGGECWITGKEQAAYPITGLSLEIAMELLTGASNVNEEIAEEYLGEKYIHLLEKTSGLDIKKATIEIIPDQIFSGIANRPTLTVKYGKKVLQNNSDYITSYKDNINAGTATITITGKGNYIGTNSVSFKIKAASISKASVTGLANKTYIGNPITQAVTVTIGCTTLKPNTDYTVSYKNNINVGIASLFITGKGNYTGTKTVTFKISKASQSITAQSSAKSVTIGKTVTVAVTGNKGTKSYKSSNTGIATVDSKTGKVTAKKVGTVKITATSAATSNYNAASKAVTIKVLPAATSSITAANQATGIKLTWKKVTGANGYLVYRGSTKIATIKSESTVTYTDTKANANGTKYTYKIIPTASTGNGTSKSLITYRVARPSISSVTNTAAGKITIKWGKNAKGTGYQIHYCTDKTFKSGNKSVSITNASTVSKVIGSLSKGKTYYLRIRTYKTVGNSKYFSGWSAVKTVKITK